MRRLEVSDGPLRAGIDTFLYTTNGDSGDDVLIGTQYNDIISGFDGDDVIYAALFLEPVERDIVSFGDGPHTVYADAADHRLWAVKAGSGCPSRVR